LDHNAVNLTVIICSKWCSYSLWCGYFLDREALERDVFSRFLFTYRKGFGAIGDDIVTFSGCCGHLFVSRFNVNSCYSSSKIAKYCKHAL